MPSQSSTSSPMMEAGIGYGGDSEKEHQITHLGGREGFQEKGAYDGMEYP